MTYRDAATLRADLRTATRDLDLTEREARALDWLAGWDQGTVDAVLGIIAKARRA